MRRSDLKSDILGYFAIAQVTTLYKRIHAGCPFNYMSVLSPYFFLFILVLGSATGPLSIEAELASLASYSSLGNCNFPVDSPIAEFEMTRKHAQRQCGRFGKKVVISSNITLAFLLYSGALEFPAPRNY